MSRSSLTSDYEMSKNRHTVLTEKKGEVMDSITSPFKERRAVISDVNLS